MGKFGCRSIEVEVASAGIPGYVSTTINIALCFYVVAVTSICYFEVLRSCVLEQYMYIGKYSVRSFLPLPAVQQTVNA